MAQRAVYMDYLATTPVDQRVAEKMQEYLTVDGVFGNPASRSHGFGWQAEQAVEHARRQVADLLGADPREIVWTSGATEADNLAIKGAVQWRREEGMHIVTSAIEHKAVLDTCTYLENTGWDVTYVEPDGDGIVQPAAVAQALREDTVLVSVMHANNETGVINDIQAIAGHLSDHPAWLHVDAAQTAGRLNLDVKALGIDLLSVSGHKLYGPKGVGALYVRRMPRVQLIPQMHGGGHERGMRSGTLPTHQIVGMGEAAEIAAAVMAEEEPRLRGLRERFLDALLELPGIGLNGHREQRLAGVANLAFEGVEGETLIMALNRLAVSTGSACTSASLEPSYVLSAMGVADELAHSSLRFSFGRHTTEADIDFAVEHIRTTLQRLTGGDRLSG